MLSTLLHDLGLATLETIYMVGMSTLFSVLIGLPLGTVLFIYNRLIPHPWLYRILSAVINVFRSIPFIILLVLLIPFTRYLVGSSIGVHAAIIPLTVGAIPFFARLVDNIYVGIPKGLIETGYSMGAHLWHMIFYILLPEAMGPLIQAITLTAITLVNYSAMAGTVGGGGLGDLAIRYGYQRFDIQVMILTVMILIILVQTLQWFGDSLAKRYIHHQRHK